MDDEDNEKDDKEKKKNDGNKEEKPEDKKAKSLEPEAVIDLASEDKEKEVRALHKTSSIFLRNLAPKITKAEVEAVSTYRLSLLIDSFYNLPFNLFIIVRCANDSAVICVLQLLILNQRGAGSDVAGFLSNAMSISRISAGL